MDGLLLAYCAGALGWVALVGYVSGADATFKADARDVLVTAALWPISLALLVGRLLGQGRK